LVILFKHRFHKFSQISIVDEAQILKIFTDAILIWKQTKTIQK